MISKEVVWLKKQKINQISERRPSWHILKKKESTGEINNTKKPGRPLKGTELDDGKILSAVKESLFATR